ncbi:unnamed protein product [Vitrella brassicaformis CCMP3155]|uniref:Uncharacterized protein n=1 Tax=Vitrella brassicaformis (strain CCMP3155) TaxID=1169540 RepID=A0A0G4F4E6_VITBC|nr:unnamed protein product [Vitrella brassicaformis CCMP3155]|eukprot:CEM06753.1 unnamed protein product [Vitrella brassicaformis CCMP3155]
MTTKESKSWRGFAKYFAPDFAESYQQFESAVASNPGQPPEGAVLRKAPPRTLRDHGTRSTSRVEGPGGGGQGVSRPSSPPDVGFAKMVQALDAQIAEHEPRRDREMQAMRMTELKQKKVERDRLIAALEAKRERRKQKILELADEFARNPLPAPHTYYKKCLQKLHEKHVAQYERFLQTVGSSTDRASRKRPLPLTTQRTRTRSVMTTQELSPHVELPPLRLASQTSIQQQQQPPLPPAKQASTATLVPLPAIEGAQGAQGESPRGSQERGSQDERRSSSGPFITQMPEEDSVMTTYRSAVTEDDHHQKLAKYSHLIRVAKPDPERLVRWKIHDPNMPRRPPVPRFRRRQSSSTKSLKDDMTPRKSIEDEVKLPETGRWQQELARVEKAEMAHVLAEPVVPKKLKLRRRQMRMLRELSESVTFYRDQLKRSFQAILMLSELSHTARSQSRAMVAQQKSISQTLAECQRRGRPMKRSSQ